MKWPPVALGQVCRVIPGFAFKSQDWTTAGIPVVKIKNIREDNTVDLSETDHVPSGLLTPRMSKFVLKNNDILVAMTGATAGKVGRLRTIIPVLLNQRVAKIAPEAADPRFIWSVVSSQQYQDLFFRLADGAAQPNMSGGQIESVEIPNPPLEVQRRIASILSAYDDLIENNARRITILEEMARRIYEEWFVRFRFPGHEGVRMVESDLGLVPQGWESTSLGAVADNHDRFRKPLSKMERETFKGPYPYYGAAKIFDHVREYIFDGQFLLLAEDGSVETPEGFPVLQLTDGKFWANNHTHILKGSDRASTEFLYLRLERQPIRGYITGAAQPKLTQAAINRIPVLLAPSGVLGEFDALIKPIFAMRAVLVRMNANLRNTRDLLLPKLISGELDVSAIPDPESLSA